MDEDKHERLLQQKREWYYRNYEKVRNYQTLYNEIIHCDICNEKYRASHIDFHIFSETHFSCINLKSK